MTRAHPRRPSDEQLKNDRSPVREKLEQAKIDAAKEPTGASESPKVAENETSSNTITAGENISSSSPKLEPQGFTTTTVHSRSRRPRENSIDKAALSSEVQSQRVLSGSRHGRKRSRDSSVNGSIDVASNRGSIDIARPVTGGSTGEKSKSGTPILGGIDTDTKDLANEEEGVSSPKTKRTRLNEKSHQVEAKDTTAILGSKAAKDTLDNGDTTTSNSKDKESEPIVKQIPSQTQTSDSAFKASGFGAFASSNSSAFGNIGNTPAFSGFASATSVSQSKPDSTKEPPKSIFGGGSSSSSAFASVKSNPPSLFGSQSSGFGAAVSGGGASIFGSRSAFATTANGPGISSFGLGKGALASSIQAKKIAKPFGAPADASDDDESEDDEAVEGGDEEGNEARKREELEKRDDRFHVQEVETGEEGETTAYSCRAKLYHFVLSDPEDVTSKKEWKERGLGTLRLNIKRPRPDTPDLENGESQAEDNDKLRARLVMRADGSHRVILNTPILKQLKFGTVNGDAPQGGIIFFLGSIDGTPKLELMQLKIRHQFALELYDHIQDVREDL